MVNIAKLPNGKYCVRWDEYDDKGKRHQHKRIFDKSKEANAFKKEIECDEIVLSYNEQTFMSYSETWWQIYRVHLEASSIEGYMRILDRAQQHFGRRLMSDIRPTTVEAFYARLMSHDNGLSDKPLGANTIKRYHALLKPLFADALNDGAIKSNPMDKVRCPKAPEFEVELPELQAVQQHILKLANGPFYTAICIAYFCGLRRSEILGLQWQDLDLKRGTISVRRVRQRLHVESKQITLNPYTHYLNIPGMADNWIVREYPKAKKQRLLTYPPALNSVLTAERQRQREQRVKLGSAYTISDFVCVYDDGLPIGENVLSKAMSSICRLHDLRHLNTTFMLDSGVLLTEAARRLGHSSTKVTEKVYAHSLKKQDDAAAERLDEALRFAYLSGK